MHYSALTMYICIYVLRRLLLQQLQFWTAVDLLVAVSIGDYFLAFIIH